jgi:hypothetical protein
LTGWVAGSDRLLRPLEQCHEFCVFEPYFSKGAEVWLFEKRSWMSC